MNVIGVNMLTNTIKKAEYQLGLHRQMGIKSTLDIFQVAELMDAIRKAKNMQETGNRKSLFFGFHTN